MKLNRGTKHFLFLFLPNLNTLARECLESANAVPCFVFEENVISTGRGRATRHGQQTTRNPTRILESFRFDGLEAVGVGFVPERRIQQQGTSACHWEG